ncbi:MAG: nucleoside-diphosphate sugar epimerase/dehydratase [Rickettsiales bacterium]|nr:nucleoside-diphosphate sugar epimerase/dehydratase [Pseudomonadota bacterium]MDA0966038.1 nucleoside-diphosphate sugar epimerase/dehydratase [Pseudomonadota bacterium]MDG4542491.1 nucleoside-diphosphate sugar epimerase/dehydratase [Rickettsiales bacterium]MDG4544995.1 nucleoside-diphosphate sugar epimerase/dehydratase [Rickettsiales bacterium]MDG4547118.1 nucleoside-diphosphate sugar epimerase/dehydratase [Rickettsiales bacterium]
MIKRSHIAALHDIFMASASLITSLYLRLGENFAASYNYLTPAILLFTASCACVFFFMGLYKGVWRYASLNDLVNIAKSVVLATLIFIPLMFMFNRLEDFPRSVLIINILVLMAMLGGPRILYRMLKDKDISLGFLQSGIDERTPVLLVGMSENGVSFLKECARRERSEYKIVGIIDNDKNRMGRKIHGITVYGDVDSIPVAIKRLKRANQQPKRVILAQDYLDKETVTKLLKMSDTLGFKLAKLPRISDFKDNIDKLEVRPIAIEDLLGRAEITPSLGRRETLINGKNILVTGAGGTIGSELVRQICEYSPLRIILLEISEYNLYMIDKELENLDKDIEIISLIGDVRNYKLLNKIFEEHKPDIVFHAAALKHVPIVEQNLIEAFMTNVIGSKNLADICTRHKVSRMVMISTDKAVNPTSLMGVTKRIAECYIQSLGNSNENSDTIFSTVRFGNVLGSSGSVIPLFQSQLEKGGPITVTHPDMERFFMTVPEAVELVLQASTIENENNDKSGIFVLDMGNPIKIVDLAAQMIKLAGFTPDEDIKITFTGVREGEKLYEELFYDDEVRAETLYKGIMKAIAGDIDFQDIVNKINAAEKECEHQNREGLTDILLQIVPEYLTEHKKQIEKDAA